MSLIVPLAVFTGDTKKIISFTIKIMAYKIIRTVMISFSTIKPTQTLNSTRTKFWVVILGWCERDSCGTLIKIYAFFQMLMIIFWIRIGMNLSFWTNTFKPWIMIDALEVNISSRCFLETTFCYIQTFVYIITSKAAKCSTFTIAGHIVLAIWW